MTGGHGSEARSQKPEARSQKPEEEDTGAACLLLDSDNRQRALLASVF
jgi:hypothetical protein